MKNLKGKKITVVGMGKSGYSACLFASKLGAEVKATEISKDVLAKGQRDKLLQEGVAVETGGHSRPFIKTADLVVSSPGVPDNALPLIWAREYGIKVIDEIELAWRFCKNPIIAVTGTNGKSTTTALIGHILRESGKRTVVCGNIGYPFSTAVLDLDEGSGCFSPTPHPEERSDEGSHQIPQPFALRDDQSGENTKNSPTGHLDKDTAVVLEISSFQLSRIDAFRPRIAIFLNVSDNHLDRHRDFKEYFTAKLRIFENQTASDWAIINFNDRNLKQKTGRIKPKKVYFSLDCQNLPEKTNRFVIARSNKAVMNFNSKEVRLFDFSALKIPGRHNVENALAASAAAFIYGVTEERIENAIASFRGLEHRCEYVCSINGVNFVNDSKSTTVDSTIKALAASSGKIILISGGRDKGMQFRHVLKSPDFNRVKYLILIGEAKEKIKTALKDSVHIKEADSLEHAVQMAFAQAAVDETVLLSPMCTSFDSFRDFEHRGEVFKEIVKGLHKCLTTKSE